MLGSLPLGSKYANNRKVITDNRYFMESIGDESGTCSGQKQIEGRYLFICIIKVEMVLKFYLRV